jgi:hypothetical protein
LNLVSGNRAVKFRVITIALVAVPLSAALLRAQVAAEAPATNKLLSEQAALALEIRQLVDELQSVRRDAASAEKKHHDDLARVQRQIDTLANQLGPAEEAVKDQRGQIKTLETKIAGDKQSAATNRAWLARLARSAAPIADAAQQRSQSYAAEDPASRSLAFTDTGKLIRDENSGRQASGVKELTRLFSDEWLPARTVGLTNQQVVLDSGARSHHAWVYRLGLVSKVFVAEGGEPIGNWTGADKSPWNLDLPAETQAQIRALMEVAREQQAPAIVPVPVEMQPDRTAKN